MKVGWKMSVEFSYQLVENGVYGDVCGTYVRLFPERSKYHTKFLRELNGVVHNIRFQAHLRSLRDDNERHLYLCSAKKRTVNGNKQEPFALRGNRRSKVLSTLEQKKYSEIEG